MTGARDPEGMTRRQTAWFGAAVVLTVTGGEVISGIAAPGEAVATSSCTPAT